MIMVVLMAAAAFLMVMVVPTAAAAFLMTMRMPMFFRQQFFRTIGVVDGPCNHVPLQLIPRRRDQSGRPVLFPDQLYTFLQFTVRHHLRPAQYDGRRISNLVVKEFPEILHIYFSLFAINHGDSAVQFNPCMSFYRLYRFCHIG